MTVHEEGKHVHHTVTLHAMSCRFTFLELQESALQLVVTMSLRQRCFIQRCHCQYLLSQGFLSSWHKCFVDPCLTTVVGMLAINNTLQTSCSLSCFTLLLYQSPPVWKLSGVCNTLPIFMPQIMLVCTVVICSKCLEYFLTLESCSAECDQQA